MAINDSGLSKDGYYINNTYSTMIPLIWLLKIFALNCNLEPNIKTTFVLLKIFCTSSVLGCINFYFIYYKIMNVYIKLDLSIKLTDMVQLISDYFQYIVDLFFVYKYGTHICIEYCKQYEKIDKFLEVTCYLVMKRRILKIMAFFVTIWIVSSFCDLGAWVVTYGLMIPIAHSVSYVFLFIKMLTVLDLIAHVTHIEVRLSIVRSLVQNYYYATDACPGELMSDCIRNKNWLYRDDGIKTRSMRILSDDYYGIKLLTKCYLLLTEQVAFINNMYGFRILLNTSSLLLDMVKVTNLSIRIVFGSQRTLYNNENYYSYLPGLTGIMRLLTCATIIISLVKQCEQAYRQREQIINVIDHLLVNKNPDQNLRSLMVELRTLLQERPICFNMANFFTLNYSLLMSIASVVVTYTIILLQSMN